jgi:hypothetical protein
MTGKVSAAEAGEVLMQAGKEARIVVATLEDGMDRVGPVDQEDVTSADPAPREILNHVENDLHRSLQSEVK